MTKPLIDTTLPIVDGQGRKVVIVHTLANLETSYPLLGVVTGRDGVEWSQTFAVDGVAYTGSPGDEDLRNVPPSKWLNVFEPNPQHYAHPQWRDSREEAQATSPGPLTLLGILERQDNGTPAGKTIFHDLSVQA